KDENFKKTLSIEEINDVMSIDIHVPDFKAGSSYKSGDTVRYDAKYYIAKEDIQAPVFYTGENIFKEEKWRMIHNGYYPVKEFVDLELIQQISFNSEGQNKKYNLKGICYYIPPDINIRGILMPVCYVKWEDLKPLLMNDEKAVILYNSKTYNYKEIMEDRNFFSFFYKTSVLKPMY
ncbi:MAG: hypothetical protein ACK4ND_19255, partial [Cytophagaceae bacterium]